MLCKKAQVQQAAYGFEMDLFINPLVAHWKVNNEKEHF